MKHDLKCVGITAGVSRERVAAAATRGYVGEPVQYSNPTRGGGTTDTNTISVCADNDPVIGTDEFSGILDEDMKDVNGLLVGAVVAQYVDVVVPIPYATKIRGKAESAAGIDTLAELVAILRDYTEFALTGGQYFIKETAAAETGALMIVDGDITRGTLDVYVDPRSMRKAVA